VRSSSLWPHLPQRRNNVLLGCAGRQPESILDDEPPFLGFALGLRPRFSLFPGDKGFAIEHRTLVLPRLHIPGFGLGRLPGMRIHAVRVTALEKVPALGELLLVGRTALRGTPVGAGFLAPRGTLLGAPLAGPEIAEAHPQPDSAQENHAGGRATLLDLCK